ncbi:protein sld2 [Aspergillus luchuensis]|uniref:DNA replication regulator SLD2 n=1 Tax=Aspergillus kawachii TaxID=1069201 RepID=A0A146FF49_ASPKA|nr:DNA replication regulator sld2 [Aspergillus luchuensis]BCS03357.1 DNA replication regulator sld2 [Aspergillus luchuensis]BCS14985.1 DNA replication regulator sld2 [Aspergillus luchuensis]GAA84888.1 DNA replication regulator Sld2 [Aspergillus luchuensis IFO 4308]GAT24506.1 DNA replication regulator Sld2 [Aspergillus luchuensis]
MATVMAPEMATQSANLRAELKEWERAFADANGGRKAERSDIKKVPEIAAKYKEYSRLKALETSSSNTKTDKNPVQLEERPKKRKHTSPNGPSTSLTTSTPRKASKGAAAAFETPSKSRPVATSHPSEVDPYDSPSVLRRLFSPSTHQSPLKTAIGPTPQRDGKALGLFDLLSESGGSTATPSATRIASLRDNAVQTPSRRKKQLDTIAEEGEEDEHEEDDDDSPRGARTPASSGKKWMLSTLFATPTTWRYAMMENENQGPRYPAYIRTNDTASKPTEAQPGPNAEETPSFLRRAPATRYNPNTHPDGDDGGLSPIAVRKRPQFVGKGLSALVQGLRDMEEEQMQNDMDILHEIEAEQLQQQQQQAGEDVANSQTQQQYPSTEVSRPFKKKGQKRTTRKVRMKPVTAKPKAEPQLPASDDEEDTQDADADADIVPETQRLNIPGTEAHDIDGEEEELNSLHSFSGSEPDLDPDYDFDEDEETLSKPPARSKSFSERMKEAIEADKPQGRANDEEVDDEKEKKRKEKTKEKTQTQPRARKVNPAAHANYRSLKLRNRGSKGRYGGRFGRR